MLQYCQQSSSAHRYLVKLHILHKALHSSHTIRNTFLHHTKAYQKACLHHQSVKEMLSADYQNETDKLDAVLLTLLKLLIKEYDKVSYIISTVFIVVLVVYESIS